MDKVVCVGSPPHDAEGEIVDAIRDEWYTYYVSICFFLGDFDEALFPSWQDKTYYLVPESLVKAAEGESWHTKEDQATKRALEEGLVDRRFEWSDDPQAPLRCASRAVTKMRHEYRQAVQTAIDALKKLP
jgi:hypothetical protein